MSKASYLMMVVFVGSLAAIVYIQQERLDLHSVWSVLLQRGTQIQSEKSCQEELGDDKNSGENNNGCKSRFVKVSHKESSNNAKEMKSNYDNIGNAFSKQDGSAARTKEQQMKKKNENEVFEEKKADNDNNSNWGHMKQLGEHGSIIMEGEIEELDFVPSGKDFYEHFLRKRKPLIMRGAIKNWPAVKHWANESYLQEKYGDVIFDVIFTKKYEGKFPVVKTMNLSEFLQIYKSKQVYLDCPFPHSDMIQDIFVPYCLQCEEIMETIASTDLLFSSGNTSSSCHMDGYENLLSIIAGTKEVLVADPKYVEYFYLRNHTTANIESPIDPEAVDLKKFPKLAEVPFYKVGLNG